MIRCDSKRISKRYDKILFAVNIPSITAAAVLLIISRLFFANGQVPDSLYRTFFLVLYAACAYSFTVTLITAVVSHIRLSGHKKYTYIEITGKQLIVSQYTSSVFVNGSFSNYRRLWIMNLSDVEQVTCKRNRMIIKSKARRFDARADWLNYQCSDSGCADFDYWWYNDNGGEAVEIIDFFDNYFYAERIAQRIIFCSEKQRAREIKFAEFRKRMLEIAGRTKTERRKKPKERVFRGYQIERNF